MTVQEFLRAYFQLGSKFQNILVQGNNGDGHLHVRYSSNEGYCEQWMRPEVRNANINAWGIEHKNKLIWITIGQ